MPVTGNGGVFFRAKDPEALGAWYDVHLGAGAGHDGKGAKSYESRYWQTQAGPSIFAPFKAATDYRPEGKACMPNFRVTGLSALLTWLRAAGIAAGTRAEGNPIEL
jgi:hypothetical protein